MQTILVIDDMPVVAERVQALLPDARILAAYNGAVGLDYVRTMETIDLVILDVRMPHNGIRVARQIREFNRTLRILPFSDYAEKADVLHEIGCAPLIAKDATDPQLLAAIRQAMAMTLLPLPSTALMDHYYSESEVEERVFRQSLARPVVVLTSSKSLLPIFEQALRQANSMVVGKTTNVRMLETFVAALTPKMIVADTGMHTTAKEFAATYQLRLLVVGLSLADTYSALVNKPDGLICDVANITVVQDALTALEQGISYRDPLLSRVLHERGLSRAHQDLIPYLLRGWAAEDIAKHISLTKETIRNYKTIIFRLFEADDVGALRDRINGLVVDT